MVLVSLSEGGEAYDILWKIIHCDNDCKLARSYPFVSEVIQARKKPSQRFAAAFFNIIKINEESRRSKTSAASLCPLYLPGTDASSLYAVSLIIINAG